MNTKPIIFVAAVLMTSAMTGCSRETTSSQNIKTPGIAALIDVTAESDKLSTVHAEMRVGGSDSNTFVVLDSGDSLTAKAGTDSKLMQATDSGEYEAEFANAAGGTVFAVELQRATEEDALNNSGTMPAPFEITGVPENSPSRSGDDVTITWSPTDAKGGDMKLSVSGTCIFSKDFDVAGDPGTFTITKGELESTSESMPQDCDLTVTMERSSVGNADPIFDSESWFRLHQVRTNKFTSKP